MEAVAIDQQFILQTLAAQKEQLRAESGISRIGLYGSFARNEQTAKSDIDLIYTVEEGHSLGLVERDRLRRILRRKLGRKLDLVNSKVMILLSATTCAKTLFMFGNRNLTYICTILERIEKIFIYTEGFTNATEFGWANNQLYFNATWGLLLVVGEESKKIDPALKSSFPQTPWQQITGMRNYLAHDYRGVDIELVFLTSRTSLVELKEVLINMMDQINYEPGALLEALDSPYYQHIQYLREKIHD